ncbi:transcription antitermination factor NusB [Halosquirtibacter xylanolyticus]|uniref:transcription antitermination factor NusB n=1 Tax=Halosquirtibacter xylanolyticus TaxID=3374599 RepID=UPI0037481331|nr:transcription antitermination factor NusB [Prolixibacteraceae bacterium]
MISRRIIRTKVMHIIYANLSNSGKSIQQSEQELLYSVNKAYDLYHLLLALPVEIAKIAEERIDRAKQKKMPTHEDLNPNMRFVQNPVVGLLRENNALNDYIEEHKLNWINHYEILKKLYQELSETDFFQEYMNKETVSYNDHKKFIENLYYGIIIPSEELEDELGELSIYWHDDFNFVCSMVIKTIKKVKEESGENYRLMNLYKDDEDLQFTKNLLRKTLVNHTEHQNVLVKYTKNWDIERIAMLDNIIMEMALTEFISFPSIPVKVTLNEYIDLAKYYSTKKSSTFVNGILDKMLQDFQSDERIKKAGRGLQN